jgi:hypothetical protein
MSGGEVLDQIGDAHLRNLGGFAPRDGSGHLLPQLCVIEQAPHIELIKSSSRGL